MYDTLRRTDLIAPKKKQLLLGILCWIMFDVGFALIFKESFDMETVRGIFCCQIAVFCASFILTALCFMPFLKESMGQFPCMALFPEALKGLGFYAILSYAASYTVAILNILVPTAQENLNQAAIDSMLFYAPVPMILCSCLFVPITEECLVRGMIFAPLCRKKPWVAYLVSSTVFAAIHVIASIGQISAMNAVQNVILYLPSGLVLGWVYQRTRTIMASIMLHGMINTVSVILTFAMY